MATGGKFFLATSLLLSAAMPAAAQVPDPLVQQRTNLAQACSTQLTLSQPACVCLAERARGELTGLQRDSLLASAVAPRAAERIGKDISQDDIRTLARFLDTAAVACSAAK